MNDKPLYEYIFNMLDYADVLYGLITPEGADNGNYFMSLVYIEDMLDKYARGLVYESARGELGTNESEMLKLANQHMDMVRLRIRSLSQLYDFDDLMKSRAEGTFRDWHKRTAVS